MYLCQHQLSPFFWLCNSSVQEMEKFLTNYTNKNIMKCGNKKEGKKCGKQREGGRKKEILNYIPVIMCALCWQKTVSRS